MQFDSDLIKNAGIAAYRSLFGGRISRTTFAIRVAILAAVVWIVFAPVVTILAPSSKTLKDVYLALSLVLLGICALGLASAYVKRLHDMGLHGFWAILFVFGLPYLLIQASYTYQNYRFHQDGSADAYTLSNSLFPVIFALPLLIALWRGQTEENRFGLAPNPVEHVATSKFNIAAIGGAATLLIPTCIYIGLFQSSIWVGRGNFPPPMPMLESNTPGRIFMKCWNVRGVGAGSGTGSMTGIYRDGYAGNVFDFIVTPNDQIDIAMSGERGGSSFAADGFRIIPYGLETSADGTIRADVRKLDHFMLAAIYDQGGSDAGINYTVFTFARDKETSPEFPTFQVILSASLTSPKSAIDLADFPKAKGRLMIGDCAVR